MFINNAIALQQAELPLFPSTERHLYGRLLLNNVNFLYSALLYISWFYLKTITVSLEEDVYLEVEIFLYLIEKSLMEPGNYDEVNTSKTLKSVLN